MSRQALSRRALLASSLALVACDQAGGATAQARPGGPLPRLRDLAPFPIGTQIVTDQFAVPVITELASTQFDQITTGYELKMEYLVQPDGRLRFDGPDRIADFCRRNNQTMQGHTLIWYADTPQWFERMDGSRRAMEVAYDAHIREVVGRYAGRIRGWDVVNEPVNTNGEGLRESLWSRNLGQEGHFARAFEVARETDPNAILFVNDYDLESNPRKRLTFMRLIEDMLNRGVPITGVGNQSHVRADLAPGQITAAIRDLASFGLPLHVSEFDVSLQTDGLDLRSRSQKEAAQVRLYEEAIEAYSALPAAQQYAFTIWGVRDTESWVRMEYYGGDRTDAPLMFDDEGAPKPTFWAVVEALRA